jgi:hypothetical protein
VVLFRFEMRGDNDVKSLPFTLLFMLVTLVVTVAGAALLLLYGWLFTLITPLDLWQTMVLNMIVLIAILVGFASMPLAPFENILGHLVYGTPIGVGIGVLIGWLLTLGTSFDAWRAMLLGVILVAAITYFLLRLSGELLDIVTSDVDEYDDEVDDTDMEVVSGMFDDAVWVDKKGRTRKAILKKGKGKKS